VAVVVLLEGSVAVQVMVVGPVVKAAPGGGVQVMVAVPELSVAVGAM
jgi:hypothetical protein